MLGDSFLDWEIVFEFRLKRGRYVRIYADVLVITENKVFSLEFKMKDKLDSGEVSQAAKYVPYLEIVFGTDYEIIPALVLTAAKDFLFFPFARVICCSMCLTSIWDFCRMNQIPIMLFEQKNSEYGS